MQVTTTKAASQASKAARSPQEKRFDKAWQRVVSQQKENDSFREHAKAFARDTRARIEDHEQAYMDAVYGACLHLLPFFSRKSLTQWQRQVLIDWLTDYLQTMQNNPFSSHLDIALIQQGLVDALLTMLPASQQLSGYPAGDLPFEGDDSSISDEEDPVLDEMFDEWLAEFEQTDASDLDDEQGDADPDKAFDYGFFQHQRAHEQQRHDESQALKRLMKSSSVNKLFRKIAGILHPDKERDETARQEKNRLMGELIKARDTNDIPRIFAFYAEYVGQSPLQELGEDLDSVTQLLERQYLYLLDLKDRFLDDDPLTDVLYQRFHRKTPAATKRAINKHLKETQDHTHDLRAFSKEITSLNKLKPYLELRYEMRYQDDILDFL